MKKTIILNIILSCSVLLTACSLKGEKEPIPQPDITPVTSTEETVQPEEPVPEPEEIIPEATHVGDFVIAGDRLTATGGAYEQDGKTSNGAEPIEWLVLEDTGDSLLLVSKDILDCKTYGEGYGETDWENSYIRKWLNEDFYNAAFNDSEKELISDYVTKEGDVSSSIPSLTDKVFLLSYAEVKELFKKATDSYCEERSAHVSEYAKSLGVWTIDESGYELFGLKDRELSEEIIGAGNWWLRDNGAKNTQAMDVGAGGNIRLTGHDVGSKLDGVRPAIRISIPSGNQ